MACEMIRCVQCVCSALLGCCALLYQSMCCYVVVRNETTIPTAWLLSWSINLITRNCWVDPIHETRKPRSETTFRQIPQSKSIKQTHRHTTGNSLHWPFHNRWSMVKFSVYVSLRLKSAQRINISKKSDFWQKSFWPITLEHLSQSTPEWKTNNENKGISSYWNSYVDLLERLGESNGRQ